MPVIDQGSTTFRRGRLGARTFRRLDFYAPRLLGARGKKNFFQKKIFKLFFKKKIFFQKHKFFSKKKLIFPKKSFFSKKPFFSIKYFFFPNKFFFFQMTVFF